MTNSVLYWRAFWGLFLRDISVLRREFIAFLIRTVMNPLFFVFVFTYLFPKVGQGFQSSAGASFGTLVLPGLLAVGIFIQGIMATALPLSMEIGATREIHDRVMSPLPVTWVAVEKICFSALQSILAALVIFPMVYFIPVSPVADPCFQLADADWHLAAGQPGLWCGRSHHRDGRATRADRTDVWHRRCAHYVSGLRVLSLGNAGERALAADTDFDQSAGLHERRTALDADSRPCRTCRRGSSFLALTIGLAVLGWIGVRGFLRRVLT